MNIKILKAAIAGLVLSVSGFANAGLIISIDYEVSNSNGYWGIGHFEGIDNNFDGLLTYNEIILFDGSNNIENETINLFTLFDVGDFDITTGTWFANAIGWNGQPDNSWFTWNNRSNSVNSTWATVTTTTTNSVPEPSTLAIFALGIMGLASRRFKK